MKSASTQFVPTRRMGLYEPVGQMATWDDPRGDNLLGASPLVMVELDAALDNQSENTSHANIGASYRTDHEASKPDDYKVRRRLAQNREAARKCRLRKKAYVQQLENSKQRLIQLEQELDRARQQGLCVGACTDTGQFGYSGNTNTGIAAFEMEYGHWVEEQDRKISGLKNALCSDVGDEELRMLVDGGMRHYFDLFAMKATAARSDVFYIMSGMWKTPAERFFLWIGGFRPSELLKVLVIPNLDPLSEQRLDLINLRQSCQQAEEALSQGMEKLHQILAQAISDGLMGGANYLHRIGVAMDKLEALVRFVIQADHLRQETLQQISRVLTTRQTARALLALGEYLQRLRALSSCWYSCPREEN